MPNKNATVVGVWVCVHVCCRKEDTGREGSLNDQCGQASIVGIPAHKMQSLIPACLLCRRKLGLMSGEVLCHSSSFLGLNFFFFQLQYGGLVFSTFHQKLSPMLGCHRYYLLR